MRLILLRQRSSAGSGNSTLISGDSTRRKGCRLGLCLLLASLALLGLAANLFLLYASIDAFLALLRRQCSKEEKWAMGERQGQEQASSPVPVPSGQPRLRISSDQLLKWPRTKNQKDGTEIAGENKPTTKMPLPLNQRITERPPKKQQPSSRTADQSSMRTTPTIAESPRNTSTRPRVRLMASDLLTRPQQAGRLPLGSSSTLASPPASLGLNSKNGRMPTVVTALFDIGRGRWTQYGRTMLQYHRFMKLLLQLRVPMVIMVDDKSVEFVHRERARIGWGGQTRVRQISLSELPLFGFQAQVKRIMGFELANWPEGWDPAMRTHPEASHPEYVLLVNSKPFFLAEAAAENPFGSEFFVWMDAGYGHGERSFFPANWEWTPNFVADKISLIKVTPPSDPAQKYGLSQLYRQDVSVFSGGFIAGNAKSIQRLHWLHRQKFIALLGRHKVDDDQTLLVLLANEEPELFHISHGDWFDAFELF